ncbi:MAG: prolipoprotein diacylglyceryl transferase [Eubacterium sp.]
MAASISIEFHSIGLKIYNMANSISLFGFEITYYGIIIGIGILTGIFLACYEAKRTGQNPDDYLDFAMYVVIASIIGARIYYVIFKWDYYSRHLSEIINLRKGGLAIYGGIIVAILTCFIYTRIKKKSFRLMADTACIGLIAGQIIGRWGNFFNREAYGTVTGNANPFAMRIYFDDWYFVEKVPVKVISAMEKMLGKSIDEIGYVQVHPTFLYESLWNLVILILIFIFRRHKKYDGEVILWYLAGYALGRVWIEGLRTDQLIMPVLNVPVSQLLSAIVIVVTLIILIYKRVTIIKKAKLQ